METTLTGEEPGGTSRREFLRSSLGTGAMLASASLTLAGCAGTPALTDAARDQVRQYRFLTADDRILLSALIPAMLDGALPAYSPARQEAIDLTLRNLDTAIHRFGPTNRAEFRSLFDTLEFAPTRLLLARVWSSWDSVEPAGADAFLHRWRDSGVDLFNNAYLALIKVTNAAYYGDRTNWGLSGYPGPPAHAVETLPQFQSTGSPA